jgi:putative ABC transport system permease protein
MLQLETIAYNVRYAARALDRMPGLAVTVVLTLALGVGAATAMYSLFHQVLVRTLPVPEPDRLVNVEETGPKRGGRDCTAPGNCGFEQLFNYAMFRDLEARHDAFAGIAAHSGFEANLAYRDHALHGNGALVSGGYFATLNLRPALGRLIGPQDEPRVGGSSVVVLSHEYWQNQFDLDQSVVGQTLVVNGQRLTIIGVAPAGFSGVVIGQRPQVFVPLTLRWSVARRSSTVQAQVAALDRRGYSLYVFARLKPEQSVEQAAAVINGLHSAILAAAAAAATADQRESGQDVPQLRLALQSGANGLNSVPATAVRAVTLLLAIAALVLTIVCANVANLLLARGATRAGELAIRASLGAGRRQLVAQLATELIMLGALGGALAVPVAASTLAIIAAIVPAELAEGLVIRLDLAAMSFAAIATLVTVALFGLLPAFQATRADLGHVLKSHSAQSSPGRGMTRLRTVLTTAQIALSMVLLVLAGLFTQSLVNLARVDLGMTVDSILTFKVSPGLNSYGPERNAAIYARIQEELAAVPGVTGVASSRAQVVANFGGASPVWPVGSADRDQPMIQFGVVSPGFFGTLGIPLLAGRDFTGADSAIGAIIVNESFVQRHKLGGNAIGSRFETETGVSEVVGVVADANVTAVKADLVPQFFWPLSGGWDVGSYYYYVRASIEPAALLRAIPQVVAGVDPDLPVSDLTTLKRQVQDNVYLDRLVSVLSAGFAVLATLLAALGLYGVLSYNVVQRTREIGLRLALGATPRKLLALVVKQAGFMALVGCFIGLAVAIVFSRVAEILLYGLSGRDPVVLVAAGAALSAVAFAASYLPARRAAVISPMTALRHE